MRFLAILLIALCSFASPRVGSVSCEPPRIFAKGKFRKIERVRRIAKKLSPSKKRKRIRYSIKNFSSLCPRNFEPKPTRTPTPTPTQTATPTVPSIPLVQLVKSNNVIDYSCVVADDQRSIIKAAPYIGGEEESLRLLNLEKQFIRELNVKTIRTTLPDIRPSHPENYNNLWWDRWSQFFVDLSNPHLEGAPSAVPVTINTVDDNTKMGNWGESYDPDSMCFFPRMNALTKGIPVAPPCDQYIANQAPRPAPVKISMYGAQNEPGHMFSLHYNDLKNVQCKKQNFYQSNTSLCDCMAQSIDTLGGYTCLYPEWVEAVRERALKVKAIESQFDFITVGPHYPTLIRFNDYLMVEGSPVHNSVAPPMQEIKTLYDATRQTAEIPDIGNLHYYDFSRSLFWSFKQSGNYFERNKNLYGKLLNVSEFGYHTLNRNNENTAVTEEAQANLLLRGWLTLFQKSVYSSNPNPEVVQACIYNLIDSPARLTYPQSEWKARFDPKEESFGLVRLERNPDNTPVLPITYTPKQSFITLRNFLRKMKDITSYSPRPFRAELSIDSGEFPRQELWFAKSDGSYLLVLWDETVKPSERGSRISSAFLKTENRVSIRRYDPFNNKTSFVDDGVTTSELTYSDWPLIYEIRLTGKL